MSLLQRIQNEGQVKSLDVTEDKANYTVAVETELFLGDDLHPLNGRYKALTNKDNEHQIFAIVGAGYQVIQHDEVVDTINEAVEDLNLNPLTKIKEMNEGGRIHGEMVFNEHYVDVTGSGDVINLRVSFDNSYDCSTGVRMNFGAFHPRKKILLFIGERYAKYYHKHTKGLNKYEISQGIKKGGELFQNQVSEMFKNMASTPVRYQDVKVLLEDCVDKKSTSIPAKYLNAVSDAVNHTTQNLWDLYLTYSEVLSSECESIDARSRHALKFLALFNKARSNNLI